jgi:predicted RNase H-like HicB family nuclease
MAALQVALPIMITREGKWFIASCPILELATQGRTEKEVKEKMSELIKEYLKDSHSNNSQPLVGSRTWLCFRSHCNSHNQCNHPYQFPLSLCMTGPLG